MKKFFAILIVLLLSACVQEVALEEELDAMFEENAPLQYKHIQNQHSVYYDYYLPSDTYATERDRTGSILKVNNYEILMNLNIVNILQGDDDKVYFDDSYFDDNYRIYQRHGLYTDYDSNSQDYRFELYEVEDRCLAVFSSSTLNFYSILYHEEVVDAAKHMLFIAKNTSIKKDEIIAAYSNENIVDYQKKQINLFETIVPKEGRLEDLFIDSIYDVSEE